MPRFISCLASEFGHRTARIISAITRITHTVSEFRNAPYIAGRREVELNICDESFFDALVFAIHRNLPESSSTQNAPDDNLQLLFREIVSPNIHGRTECIGKLSTSSFLDYHTRWSGKAQTPTCDRTWATRNAEASIQWLQRYQRSHGPVRRACQRRKRRRRGWERNAEIQCCRSIREVRSMRRKRKVERNATKRKEAWIR